MALKSTSARIAGAAFFVYVAARLTGLPPWLGVFASTLLVLCLPLRLAGLLRGPVTQYIWLPMLLFEVPLACWLIVKGVREPAGATSQHA